MEKQVDERFYERADAHISLSNEQTAQAGEGRVSASMMYATARFNAWLSARGFPSAGEMAAAKEETIAYFAEQYRLMLADNLDDYIANFDRYMGRESAEEDR